jgi:hypothetical protein
MGGIGKTTIAEEIFSQNYFEYEGWCFLACWIRNLNVGIYPYDSGCLEFKVTSLLYQNSILRLVIFLLFLYIYIYTHIRDCRFFYYWFGMKNGICFQHMKAEAFVFSIWKLRFCYLLTECSQALLPIFPQTHIPKSPYTCCPCLSLQPSSQTCRRINTQNIVRHVGCNSFQNIYCYPCRNWEAWSNSPCWILWACLLE